MESIISTNLTIALLSKLVILSSGFMGFQNSRARWWYFAVSNCDNPNGVIKMKYSLTLTNGESFWQKHVSADEHGRF